MIIIDDVHSVGWISNDLKVVAMYPRTNEVDLMNTRGQRQIVGVETAEAIRALTVELQVENQ